MPPAPTPPAPLPLQYGYRFFNNHLHVQMAVLPHQRQGAVSHVVIMLRDTWLSIAQTLYSVPTVISSLPCLTLLRFGSLTPDLAHVVSFAHPKAFLFVVSRWDVHGTCAAIIESTGSKYPSLRKKIPGWGCSSVSGGVFVLCPLEQTQHREKAVLHLPFSHIFLSPSPKPTPVYFLHPLSN